MLFGWASSYSKSRFANTAQVECGCGLVSETGPRGRNGFFWGELEEVTGCTNDVDVTDDSNQYTVDGVGDGDGADFLVDHDVDDVFDFGSGVYGDDVALHEGADGGFEASIAGVDGVKFIGHWHRKSANIAVTDHANQLAVIDNR